MSIRLSFIAALVGSILFGGGAQAGVLSVFGDVTFFAYPGNEQMALNLLDGGTNSLISSRTSDSRMGPLHTFYNEQAGLTSVQSDATLTTELLTGIDLLVLDIGYLVASPYDTSEHAVIADFLFGGGNVALVAEPRPLEVASINALLAGIGSSIFMEAATCCGNVHYADTILSVPLTEGVSAYTLGAAHPLTGGTAAIQDQGYTIVAFEIFQAVQVPEAATLALFVIGLAGLGFARNRVPSTKWTK